jgi:ABC-type nitrate/sulfonate/bicarbonate transport system substrate-binding protein
MIARDRPGLTLLLVLGLLAGCSSQPAARTNAPSAPPAASQPAASGGATSAPAAGAAPTSAPAALTPIRIAYSQVAAAFAPVWIANDQGFFKKEGLDAEVVNLAKPIDIQSLVSGDVQITVDGSAAIDAIAGGANLTYIAVPLPVYTQGVYGQPSIQSIRDLVGKNVGVTSQGGSSDNALRTLFMRDGVDQTQVNIVYLREDAAILAALQTGTVQAAILTSPNTLRAREAGMREIVDTVPLNLRTINTGISVRKDWAREHEDQVLSFLRAYMEASKVAKTDPATTKALITKYTGLDDAAMLNESYENSAAGWAIYPLIRDADVQNVIDLSNTAEVKARKPSDYYDNSYLLKLESFARGLDPQSVGAAP